MQDKAIAALPTAARETLRRWLRIVAEGDFAALPSVLADDVRFRSPFL